MCAISGILYVFFLGCRCVGFSLGECDNCIIAGEFNRVLRLVIRFSHFDIVRINIYNQAIDDE